MRLSFSPSSASSSSPQLFRNVGEFVVKKYFTDHWITSTIQLFVGKIGNISGLFFLWTSRSDGEFPRDCLINIATRLFVCYIFCRLINKNELKWLLLIMCKEHSLRRSTNLFSRNHRTLYFWLRREGRQMPITELNSTQLPSLNLITMLSFEPRLRMLSLTVTTQKANACSPWTPCYFWK